MTEFPVSNPRLLSSPVDPYSDPVRSIARPHDYRAFLSETDFAERAWNTSFGADRFFYLTGVTDAMRLLKQNSGSFLKIRGYLDAVLGDHDLARWSDQSGVRLEQPIKRERANEITVPKPTYFYKCVECLVAFELAFADQLKGKMSPYWVYDYMRVVPAVYNLRKFNNEKLALLRREYEGFDRLALNAMRQHNEELLDDLSNGKTVTRPTAFRLKHFIDTYCTAAEEHTVGEIRSRPGNRSLGEGPATIHESVEPDISAHEGDA